MALASGMYASQCSMICTIKNKRKRKKKVSLASHYFFVPSFYDVCRRAFVVYVDWSLLYVARGSIQSNRHLPFPSTKRRRRNKGKKENSKTYFILGFHLSFQIGDKSRLKVTNALQLETLQFFFNCSRNGVKLFLASIYFCFPLEKKL